MKGWLAALALAILPHAALAQGYVACLKAQLSSLGHDIQQIDATLTPDALAAASTYLDPDRPPLTYRTAFDWCRSFGQSDLALRAHWPSLAADLLWMPPALSDTTAPTVLRAAMDQARTFFADAYGQSLVGGVGVFAGDDPRAIEAAAIAFQGDNAGPWQDRFRKRPVRCGTGDIPAATTYLNLITMCWATPDAHDAAWQDRYGAWYARSFAHEYVHALQNELVGVHAQRRLTSGERALGPAWLVEGSAEVLEGEFFADLIGRNALSLGTLVRRGRQTDKPLSQMRMQIRHQTDYDVSELAAYLLGERFGRQAYFAYFEAVRGADSWSDAFTATFGMTLDEYEAQFEVMRGNLARAHTFARGTE